MIKARLLSSAAVVLVIGLGAATAQTRDNAPEPAPAAQQSAPAEKVAPTMKAGEAKPAAKAETTGQAAPKPGPTAGEMKAGAGNNAQANDAHANAIKPADGAKPAAATTGQGAAGAGAKLTTEQRSKITTVIRQQKAEPVKLDISISVGTRVPEHVHYYPLPAEVVTVYPEWRGYDYIIVGSTIVVIDPDTRQIVAVLEA